MAAAKPNQHGYRSVSTKWSSGNLQFLDSSANVIATVDAANRALSIASGAVLRSSSGNAPVDSATLATLSAQNVTPTAAQIYGGIVAHVTVTGGGTFTLPTAANIDAAIPGVATNDSFQCLLANTGTQTSTITTNTGLTLVGTVAVTTGKTALMTFLRTGAAAWTVYCLVSA